MNFFRLWKIKGNALQGDVQPNCVISLTLRFKLALSGSISIEYSLPTSVVIGIVNNRLFNYNFKRKKNEHLFRFLRDVILVLMIIMMMRKLLQEKKRNFL